MIFISIDEHESHNLRKICDEIFGISNFLSQIVWEKRYTRSNNAKRFTTLTELVLCYVKNSAYVFDIKERRNEKADSIYMNPDNGPRGVWTSVSYVNPATNDQRPNLSYRPFNPITQKMVVHPTYAWKYERATYEQHVKDNKLYWGKNGENSYPRLKKFLFEMEGGIVPVDLWSYEDSGSTDIASKELESLLGRKIFDFPNPKELIMSVLSLIINAKQDNSFLTLDFSQVPPLPLMPSCNLMQRMVAIVNSSWCNCLKPQTKRAKPTRLATKISAKSAKSAFVMRDSSLANDQVADNFEQIFEAYSKETVRRVL